MKTTAFLVAASMVSASAFVPAANTAQSSTQLSESLFKRISNMDMWAPIADSNDYGARQKKGIMKKAPLSQRSYVPGGMTKAQYEQVRQNDQNKLNANYQRNVAKGGKFQNFTSWYSKRGTAVGGGYRDQANNGHTMCKTKYDWSGEKKGTANGVESAMYTGIGIGK